MTDDTPKKTFGDRVDDLIGLVNPRRGAQRRGFRQMMRVQETQFRIGANRGATSHRGNSGWLTDGGSANADINDDLPTLRARSRDLIANDGRAQGVMKTLVTSVVGAGINPLPSLDHEALGISEGRAREIEKEMKMIFLAWNKDADASRRLNFFGLQRQAYRSKKTNGEYIYLPQMVRRPGRRFQFCLHGIESDRLSTPGAKIKGKVYAGVRVGRFNEPIGYYIQSSHPGEDTIDFRTRLTHKFIRAEDSKGRKRVLHGFDVERSGQTHGKPSFSAVLDEFHDLDEYREAERYAMRLGACIGLIINDLEGDGSGELTTVDGKQIEGMEPGMIWRGSNLEISQVNPMRPGSNFQPFIRDIDQTIGVSQGIGYELASKYFGDANYSTLRAAYIEARRYYRVEQEDLVHFLCQPSWEWLMEEAFLSGALDLPNFHELKHFWLAVDWTPQPFDWVDPDKEISAAIKGIRNGLTTRQKEMKGSGEWSVMATQLGAEEKILAGHGLPGAFDGDIKTTRTEESEEENDGNDES